MRHSVDFIVVPPGGQWFSAALLAERWDLAGRGGWGGLLPSQHTKDNYTHAKWLHLCIQPARCTQVGQIILFKCNKIDVPILDYDTV